MDKLILEKSLSNLLIQLAGSEPWISFLYFSWHASRREGFLYLLGPVSTPHPIWVRSSSPQSRAGLHISSAREFLSWFWSTCIDLLYEEYSNRTAHVSLACDGPGQWASAYQNMSNLCSYSMKPMLCQSPYFPLFLISSLSDAEQRQ